MLVRSEAGVLFSCGSAKRGRLGRPYSLDAASLTAEEDESSPVHHGIPGEVWADRCDVDLAWLRWLDLIWLMWLELIWTRWLLDTRRLVAYPSHQVILGENGALAATVAAADNHAAAVSVDGVPYVWGANDAGLLGLDAQTGESGAPLEVGAPRVDSAHAVHMRMHAELHPDTHAIRMTHPGDALSGY